MKCSIAGHLLKDAEIRSSTGHDDAQLIVQVLQPGDAMPFVAVQHVPADESEDLRARGRRMVAGSGVLVLGSGIVVGTHEGNTVLKLQTVHGILRVNLDYLYTQHDAGVRS